MSTTTRGARLAPAPRVLSQSASPVRRYLDALFGSAPAGSLVELRRRHAGGMRQSFVDAARLDAVEHAVVRGAPLTDVFVGVLPRRRRGGRRADVVASGHVLWVDSDGTASRDAVQRFPLPPAVVVESGSPGHIHAYWLLADVIDVPVIEALNVRLATALGGDPRSSDAGRILRPPSLNHKHRPAAVVRLVRCEAARRYSAARMGENLPDDDVGAGGEPMPRPSRVSDGRDRSTARPHLGLEIAFQANTGYLWVFDSVSGGHNEAAGMATGTSPSLGAMSSGAYEVAFQANTGTLWVGPPNNTFNTGDGLRVGTNPSIAISPANSF